MEYLFKKLWVLVPVLLISNALQAFPAFTSPDGDVTMQWSGKFKIDTYYGENIFLFNTFEREDRAYYTKHNFDINLDVTSGQKTFGSNAVEFFTTIRNKGVWGNPASIVPTNGEEVKFLDARLGGHKHYIPRHLLWIRELWLELDITKVFGLTFCNDQTFTIGAFPFSLGRGIALGDVYTVGQGFLGFYTESDVDQYAFGAKIGGDLMPDFLTYDFYVGILQNKSSNYSDTSSNLYGQEINNINAPQRGFGKVDFVVANHFMITPIKDKCATWSIEPYWMYNNAPEQKIEFLGDASSQLGSFGVASEFVSQNFEFGVDTAFNVGSQTVKGWDRNIVQLVNDNGAPRFVNSHVYVNADPNNPTAVTDLSLYKAPFIKTAYAHSGANPEVKVPKNQTIQNILDTTVEGQQYNGSQIGALAPFNATTPVVQTVTVQDQITAFDIPNGPAADVGKIFNAKDRYRNGYKNKYQGWMAVGDVAWWACDHKLCTAFTAGAASGDANPNDELIDGNFKGFIPLQEGYAGKRVKSAFVLGGAGKIRRPLSQPTDDSPDDFAPSISGFTDLVFVGSSLKYTSTIGKRKYEIMPNVLAFWKYFRVPKFDALQKKEVPGSCASNFYGTEVNVQAYLVLIKDLKLSLVTSVFVPGQHYKDRAGLPLTAAQNKALDNVDKTGFDSTIPNLGFNVAYTLNVGLEYSF